MDIALNREGINPIWDIFYRVIMALTSAINKARVIPYPKEMSYVEAQNFIAERYMHEYGNAILRLAYSYAHNMYDAEDILQDTLIKVLEVNPTFLNANHEKAYLLKTASNIAKNRIKYYKLRNTDELLEELVAEEREDLSFVWEAVKNLPDMAREVIHLYYQEGYQTSEIADIIGRKESTIRSDLKRARNHLKKILKEEYDFG